MPGEFRLGVVDLAAVDEPCGRLIAAGYVAIGRLSVSITISLQDWQQWAVPFAPRHHPTTPGQLDRFLDRFHVGVDVMGDDLTSTGAKAIFGSRANTSSSFRWPVPAQRAPPWSSLHQGG